MINDNAWRSMLFYLIAEKESNFTWNCIESGAQAGIGIAQWTYSRACDLLQKCIGAYPDIANTYFTSEFINIINAGFDQYYFTDAQAEMLRAALKTNEFIEVQNTLMNSDIDNYVNLVNSNGIKDGKVAILWILAYHQSPKRAMQILNGVGGGCTIDQMHNAIMSERVLSQYKTRYTGAYNTLKGWDEITIVSFDGQQQEDPASGSDEDPYENSNLAVNSTQIKYVQMHGDNLIIHSASGKILCYKASACELWLPRTNKVDQEVNRPSGEVSASTTGDALLQTALTIPEGSLTYSQAQSQRMNIEGGYADCSSFMYWIHNKHGLSIPTWTGGLWNDTTHTIASGTGLTGMQSIISSGGAKTGDIFVWKTSNSSGAAGHVEMYDGNNGLTYGVHGTGLVNPSYTRPLSCIHEYWKLLRYWDE